LIRSVDENESGEIGMEVELLEVGPKNELIATN